MRFSFFKMCAFAFALISFSGCASSLLYSPSLNLPAAPLKKGQGQIIIGGILLPETRPSSSRNGNATQIGAEGLVRYAFDDDFSMSIKAWSDFGNDTTTVIENGEFTESVNLRGGYSVQGSFLIPSPDNYKFAVIPTAALLRGDVALGVSIAFASWFPKVGIVTPYAALGPAVGVGGSPNAWGYGAISNIGMAVVIFKNFTLNAEVAGIIQVNQHDKITHGIVSPSVSLGWTF